MAVDPRKRQKQLARKAAKRKAAVASKKRPASFPGALSGARHMTVAAQSPFHECLMAQALFEAGMGTVLVSRTMPNGLIAVSCFLLDVFCLGIKNAYFVVEPRADYQWRLEQIRTHEPLVAIAPEYARKLVEDTEAYARDLGFAPHPDYQLAQLLLASIDATACDARFTFGQDGKPLYIAGPYDTPQRMRTIQETLLQRCGPQGFHYLALAGDPFEFEGEEDEAVIEAEYRRLR